MDSDALNHRRSGSCVQIGRTSFSCTSAAANARAYGVPTSARCLRDRAVTTPARQPSLPRALPRLQSAFAVAVNVAVKPPSRSSLTALKRPFRAWNGGEPAGIRTQDTRIKSLSGQRSRGAVERLAVHAARGARPWPPPIRQESTAVAVNVAVKVSLGCSRGELRDGIGIIPRAGPVENGARARRRRPRPTSRPSPVPLEMLGAESVQRRDAPIHVGQHSSTSTTAGRAFALPARIARSRRPRRWQPRLR